MVTKKTSVSAKRDVSVPPAAELHAQIAQMGELQEDGSVLLSEEQIEEIGAINAEAMQSNMALLQVEGKKKAGHIMVSWGVQDAPLMYDQAVRVWPPSTLSIHVVRLSGAPIAAYLRGEPRNGREFYDALASQIHKCSDQAEYKITLKDKQNGLYKGTGRVILPSTLDDPNAGAMVSSPQYQARPASMPTNLPLPFGMGLSAGPFASPNPMPSPAAAPPAPSLHSDPVFAQLLTHIQSLTQQVVTMSRAQQVPLPPSGYGSGGAPPAAAAAAAAAPAPAPPMPPPPPPPEGATFFMPGVGWVTRAKAPGQEPAAPSAIDQMRASLATVGEMTQVIEQAKRVVPGLGQAPKMPAIPEPEPEPIKTIDIGEYKIVQGTEDGKIRPVETLIANGSKIMDFVSRETERYATMQRQAAERNAAAARAAPPQAASAPAALPDGAATA